MFINDLWSRNYESGLKKANIEEQLINSPPYRNKDELEE